jgi:hypothetical protein
LRLVWGCGLSQWGEENVTGGWGVPMKRWVVVRAPRQVT